jgi:GAF domain-containing protein
MRNPIFRSPQRPANRLGQADQDAASGLSSASSQQQSAAWDSQFHLQSLRQRILRGVLGLALVLALVAYLANLPVSLQRAAAYQERAYLEFIILGLYTALLIALLVLFISEFWNRVAGRQAARVVNPRRYQWSATILLLLILFLGTSALLTDGLYGSGRVFLITLPVIAAILLDRRGGLLALFISLIVLITVGLSMAYGFLPAPELAPGAGNASLLSWLTAIANFTLFALISAISLIILLQGLEESLTRQAALANMLEHERSQLENRIRLRTVDLERRLVQIRTAAEISQQIAARQVIASAATGLSTTQEPPVAQELLSSAAQNTPTSSTPDLLAAICELVRQRFDLYYVGIFLLPHLLDPKDPRRQLQKDDLPASPANSPGAVAQDPQQNAILVAGTGLAGAKMLANSHQLPLRSDSMIGWAILNRQARIALDVGREAVRFQNPHLPETRSELALPIIFQGQALGAITIQSKAESAFDQNDITILQGIADSLGAAIENSRLITQSRSSLAEIQGLHRQYLERAWGDVQASQGILEYSLDKTTTTPAKAQESGSTENTAPLGRSIETPIKLRGHVIGSLILEDVPIRVESGPGWSEEELALIEAVTNQTALALENARLLEETRMSAAHQQLTASITSKVWSTPDIELILQTTLRELSQALQISQGWIALGPADATEEGPAQAARTHLPASSPALTNAPFDSARLESSGLESSSPANLPAPDPGVQP